MLAHSYAVTSHAAEGDTYEAARHLGTERSSRPGVYVGLSRGRSDSRLYLVRKAEVSPSSDRHLELPRLDAQTTLLEAVTARLTAERHERLASEVDPDAADVARLRATLSVTALQRASVVDGAHGELARRALEQQLTAVAAAARLDPGPTMTARLGPRPVDGDHRGVWERAVGEAARYRATHDVGALDPHASGGAWALGPRPDGPAAKDYDRGVDLIATAELAYATRLPTAELAREHRDLTNTLALDPAHRHLDAAMSASVVAAQRLAQAHQDLERAQDRVGVLEAAPRRRRNSQGIEAARRCVAVAEPAMAQADLVATGASQRVEAAQVGADAQRPVRDLLNLVDRALHAQVDAAVTNPAGYLCAALGPVPEPGPDRDAWAERATAVEAYRHRELGLAPADGALSADDSLFAAIGAEPDDFASVLLWRSVAARIAADELALDVVEPDLGIDL